MREWSRRNPERVRELRRLSYASRPGANYANFRRWALANPEKRKAQQARYRARHRAELHAKDAAYREARPDIAHARTHRYRARVAAASGSFTPREWREKCALFANLCAYCGEAKKLGPDHKMPLSRGGTNSIENIVPACRGCNSRKGARTATEFLAVAA